jgi:hypothetical protein
MKPLPSPRGTQPSEQTSSILLDALYRLAQLDGLTTREIAVRCILTGTVPTTPAFSPEVINAYQKLEAAA